MLVNLADEELKQDEWSLTAPRFGEEGHLEVIGWNGRNSIGCKLYILKCTKCSQDAGLFDRGYFNSDKGALIKGQIPCGCSRSPRWTAGQYNTICSRKAAELGYTFLDFVGEWRGKNTKIKMLCEKHGEWTSGNINDLTNSDKGCPACGIAAVTKPDDVMIRSFLASGSFHPDTKFWRSERLNTDGHKCYWYLLCPECGDTGESFTGDLQKGKRPCTCNVHRQQEAYINWVVDDRENAVAIKFGIANNSKQRLKRQNLRSVYTLIQHSIHSFTDVHSCRKAERECLQELECGVVLKRDMKDGYTETTWLYNLDKIIEIYERNGGTKIE